MKEIEDLIFDCIDNELASQVAVARGCMRAPDDKNYTVREAYARARQAYEHSRRVLVNLMKTAAPKLAIQELFDDYAAFKERHGPLGDPKDIPTLFSQELANLRCHHAVAHLALQEAYARQFDETASARCATSSGPGSSPDG